MAAGLGAASMIAHVMARNLSSAPLQLLGASVLSNMASVDRPWIPPSSDMDADGSADAAAASEAAHFRRLVEDAVTARARHPSPALHPTAAEASSSARIVGRAAVPAWELVRWLCVEQGTVEALTAAAAAHPTDTSLVEACLGAVASIAGGNAVTDGAVAEPPESPPQDLLSGAGGLSSLLKQEVVLRHDALGRVLAAMRAADYDAPVLLAGSAFLLALARDPATHGAVVSSDAAYVLCGAAANFIPAALVGLRAAASAVCALPRPPSTGGGPNTHGSTATASDFQATTAAQLGAAGAAATALVERAGSALPLVARVSAERCVESAESQGRRDGDTFIPPLHLLLRSSSSCPCSPPRRRLPRASSSWGCLAPCPSS